MSVAGTADVSFSTFVDNTSNNSSGGGLDRNGGSVTATNSILTNANQGASDGSDCSGTPDLVGVNVVGNAQGCNPGPDVIVGQALLGPLVNNGGATPTIALLEGSVGVDAALSCETVNGTAVDQDQRSVTRPATVGTTPLCDVGAFEIAPLEITLSLSAQSLEDVPEDPPAPALVQVGVGATTLQADLLPAAINQTAGLFAQGTLEANPLSTFPLATFPLSTFPLSTFPLDTVLLSDLVIPETDQLADLGATWAQPDWATLLAGSPFEATPLQSISLSDLYQALNDPALDFPNSAEILALDMRQFNIASTPLSTFPLATFLLAGVPLSTFPLSTFDSSTPADQWCALLAPFCDSLPGGTLTPDVTLATVALAGVSLQELNLGTAPLSTFLVEALPLSTFPLSTFPLATFDWVASPLSTFPLSTFSNPDTFVDCSGFADSTCDGKTFQDAVALGLITGATLADFAAELAANGALFDDPFYSIADLLLGVIPGDQIPWEILDLNIPGIQNAQSPPVDPFQYLADFTLTSAAETVTVQLTLPAGFAYVPRDNAGGTDVHGTFLDGAPIADPVLSISEDDPSTEPDESGLVTMTFELGVTNGGPHVLAVDVRASLTLGLATATATASGTDAAGEQADAGPVSTFVEVIARDLAASPLNDAALEIIDDEISLNYVAGSEDVDIYAFEITAMQANLGAQASILLSNLPADYDLAHYVELTDPLIFESGPAGPVPTQPTDSVGYLDNVIFDLNPSDDVSQADVVQDIPDVLASALASPDHVVRAISSNRGTVDESIETGTLRAGIHYVQVSSYNASFSNEPYALRIKVTTSPPRQECAAVDFTQLGWSAPPDPLAGGPAFDIAALPADLNTILLMNSQVLEATYGGAAAADVALALSAFEDVALAGPLGVRAAVLAVDSDVRVRQAYAARHASPCDPQLANNVVREITRLVQDVVAARPTLANVVIVGDDRQIPMANIVDEARFANERTFAQNFSGNNESIAALVAGMYRSDDVYGTDNWFRVRDHELYVPSRAVGRLVESPSQIINAANKFFAFGGRLDPATEANAFGDDTAFVTGYEFLADGAEANVRALETGYGLDGVVDCSAPDGDVACLIDETWTGDDLATALETPYDIVGINGHFDERYALAASGNSGCADPTNPGGSCSDLFGVDDLPAGFGRTLVYSMGCHAGYSRSDIQIGTSANAPDWAQTFAEADSLLAANTGFGYGDTLVVALGEQLTTYFADEATDAGSSVGNAWVDAKQAYLSDLVVLDAYHEKTMMQFVFYGLPMYHVDESPAPLAPLGQGLASAPAQLVPGDEAALHLSSIGLPALTVQAPLVIGSSSGPATLAETTTPSGTYYDVDGDRFEHSGLPIQPLNKIPVAASVAVDGTTYAPRDALVVELVSEDIADFDPVFFRPTIDQGANEPRAEYLDGSFPAEIAAVGLPYFDEGVAARQLLLAAGQYQGSPDVADLGTQRLHTYTEVEVYYGPMGALDKDAPLITRSEGFVGNDVVFFEVDTADAAGSVGRVYVMFREEGAVSGAWTGVDLSAGADGTWRGGWPFSSQVAEFFVQAVDDSGNVAISDSKALNFNTAVPAAFGDVALSVASGTLDPGGSFWYVSDVSVTAAGPDPIFVSLDGGPFQAYSGPLALTSDGAHVIVASDNAFGAGSSFAILYVAIDQVGPTFDVTTAPDVGAGYVNQAITVAVAADDGVGAGIASIVVNDATGAEVASSVFSDPNPDTALLSFDWAVDGETEFTAIAGDAAGNLSSTTFTLRIDTQGPTLESSRTPDDVWAMGDVVVSFDAVDSGGSGVAEIRFTTDGSVPSVLSALYDDVVGVVVSGEGSTVVSAVGFDGAGNVSAVVSETVQIDLSAPEGVVTLSGDQGEIGTTELTATFSCDDPIAAGIASGVSACSLAVDDGSGLVVVATSDGTEATVVLPASNPGSYDLVVAATDVAGNHDGAAASASYGVGYGVCLEYDPTQTKNIGSNYTIRLHLCDADGANLSARGIVLTAISITDASGGAVALPLYSGNSNQPFTFRYSNGAQSYIYNLDTSGMPPGPLTLAFTASDTGALEYHAPFALE